MVGGSHGFAEGLMDLPSQHVKVVGWGGAVHHDPVTVVQLTHSEVVRDFLQQIGITITHRRF